MPWSLDDSIQRNVFNRNRHFDVPGAAIRKYHDWKRLVVQGNMAPNLAAAQVGDTHYEQLGGRNAGEFTIRLSQQHRVAFTVDSVNQHVTVFQIGGHYPDEQN